LTAHGIRRVIAQLRDAGRTSACVVCPICEGGTRKRATLSVDLRDGVWLYLCHRATCPTKGAVPEAAMDGDFVKTAPVFQPRPLLDGLRLPERGDPIGDRVYDRIEGSLAEFAARHGLRVLESAPTTHTWIVHNMRGERMGHITRDEDKRIRVWRESEGPFYAVFWPKNDRGPTQPYKGAYMIVEDALSAALMAEEGVRAIALLGTNLSREAAQEIAVRLPDEPRIAVAMDPDEAGVTATSAIVNRLRALGVPAVSWVLPSDVKNLPIATRKSVAEKLKNG
jgi:hypothetical protein